MDIIYKCGEYTLLKYKPTITRLFYVNMEPITIVRRIRFLIDLLYGYSVYYLQKDGDLIGYCTITNGKNPRFWFANSTDIIVGPYYIKKQYRGKGLSTYMIDTVINKSSINWNNAYAYILNTNTPSIHTIERNGGTFLFHVHNTIYRQLVKSGVGEYGVYRISHDSKEE